MTKLPNVTLCSVDCVEPYLALTSLIESSNEIEFKSIILFSNIKPVNIPENIKFICIPKINSLIEYSKFIIKDLYKYIDTDFVLTVQADGYIHNPKGWTNEFLDWDYIGAPWQSTEHFIKPGCRVGNGGVSLRSKNLLRELQDLQFLPIHEDVFISIIAKEYLENKGIKIAPLNIAARFSVEKICSDINILPEIDCLAFHGKTYTNFHEEKTDYLHKKALKIYPHMNINNIELQYNNKKNTPSDINEHLPTLYEYALKCNTIAEFGVRNVTSSYAFAHARPEELLCLDIDDNVNVKTFINECKQENINASFVHASSLDYELPREYDLLFIDTLHTFDQLTQELNKHHSKITKYIIFHDTIFWGHKNENPVDSSDTGERGDTVGLVPAIGNFLKTHKEWREVGTYTNNNGLTIIERKPEPYLVYRDILVGQTKTTPNLLNKIIKENNISVIIEIGTHRGGLSLWLNDNKPNNCDFYTVDITAEHLKIDLKKENIQFLLGDCFTSQFKLISELIQKSDQVLLLCDGGNKEAEFKVFAPLLKPNDIIMCHDFADDQLTYVNIQQQIGWPSGSESHMSNLATDVNKNNLMPYLFEEAKHCFWGCFKKNNFN